MQYQRANSRLESNGAIFGRSGPVAYAAFVQELWFLHRSDRDNRLAASRIAADILLWEQEALPNAGYHKDLKWFQIAVFQKIML